MLKQSSHNGLKTNGLALDFSTVPFRRWQGITSIAMECNDERSLPFGRYDIVREVKNCQTIQ